jgi:Ca2+/H+ antiporter
MVVYQAAFVLLHVSIIGPWYSEKILQILEKVSQVLSRSKRIVGLIIAGIVNFNTLIASTTASAIILREVKTATFVSHLAKKMLLMSSCVFKSI